MFMNDDNELHSLIRTELILPFIFGDFHPQDLNEHFGGLLFAFLKADGVGIRPLNFSTATRRCASALVGRLVVHAFFHYIYPQL